MRRWIFQHYFSILLLLILCLSLIKSVIYLDKFAPAFNRDELSIGYNAYSVLHTGYDEHGVGPYPINFKSFGEYKLPGLVYLVALSYWLWEFNTIALRLPTAVLSSLIPVLFGLVIRNLTKNQVIGLLSALMILISPWHLVLSRQTYEPITASPFFLLGILLLLKSTQKIWLLFLSLGSFIIASLIYNVAFLIFLPLMIFHILMNRNSYSTHRHYKSILTGIIILSISSFAALAVILSPNTISRSNTTFFSDQEAISTLNDYIHELHLNSIPIMLARVYVNKIVSNLNLIGVNFFKPFGFDFIFGTTELNPWKKMTALQIGHFSTLFIPFFLIGIFQFTTNVIKKQKGYIFIFIWMILTLVPNSLTKDSPSTNRLIDFLLISSFFIALGLHSSVIWITRHYHKKYAQGFLVGVISLILLSYSHVLINYFYLFPYHLAPQWNYKINEAVKTISDLNRNHDVQVYVGEDEILMSYIYFAYFTPFEPHDFQTNSERIQQGLNRVIKYNEYFFEIPKQNSTGTGQKSSLILTKINDLPYKLIHKEATWEGIPLYKIYRY